MRRTSSGFVAFILLQEVDMSRRSVILPATITFRVPQALDARLRAESDRGAGALADVARRYLLAGIAATDAGWLQVDAVLMDGPAADDVEAVGRSR